MLPITPAGIRRILAVTDSLHIHREAVVIPLAREGDGGVRLKGGSKIEISAPETGDLEGWLIALPALLSALDLSRVKRLDPEEP